MPQSLTADVHDTLREVRAYLEDWRRAGLTDLVPSQARAELPPAVAAEQPVGEGGCVGCRRKKCLTLQRPQAAELAFVVMAPSRGDVERGQLLSGEVGQLFDAMLRAMGRQRDEVFCTSVLRCAASSRTLDGDAPQACRQVVTDALRAVRPHAIVVFGEAAAQALLEREATLRGRWHAFVDIPLRVTHTPGDLLQTPALKREAWEDLKEVLAALRPGA